MFVDDTIQDIRKELDKSLEILSELESFYSERVKEYADIKLNSQTAHAIIAREERSNGKKLSATELRERIHSRLAMNSDYQELTKLEAEISIAEKRYKVVKSKIDALRLKLDLLKS